MAEFVENQSSSEDDTTISETKHTTKTQTPECKSETESKIINNDYSNIYVNEIPNYILTNRKYTTVYYKKLAAKSLRANGELTIVGKGNNIGIAVTLSNILKEQNICDIQSIKTGLDMGLCLDQSIMNNGPIAMMTFKLCKGKFGNYISGYQKCKIIKIFQKYDTFKEGYLTFDIIESFKFIDRFFANEQQINQA
eukprot:825055_1